MNNIRENISGNSTSNARLDKSDSSTNNAREVKSDNSTSNARGDKSDNSTSNARGDKSDNSTSNAKKGVYDLHSIVWFKIMDQFFFRSCLYQLQIKLYERIICKNLI